MVAQRQNNNNNEPQQRKQPVAITEPSAMVQQMAQQSFAMKNGGVMPMQGAPNGNTPPVGTISPANVFATGGVTGRFERQPVQTGAAPTTDFTNMPSTPQFNPQTAGNANPNMGPVSTPYIGDTGEATPQHITNFEQMPVGQQGDGWNPNAETSDVGYKGGPYDPSKYDSLSAALNGSAQSQQVVPEFQKDDTKRDGGFFNWMKGLIPKKRPGMRDGETPDEYDRRMTTNMERLATLADAFRHIGNIINTSKGAPLQQFNDPTTMLEQGYQNRKAQRQKQAAADADAAYKQANLTLKERAAEADRAYKKLSLGFKQSAEERAARNDEFNRNFKTLGLQRQLDNDKFNQYMSGEKFREQMRHNRVSEGQSAARLSLSSAKFAYQQAKDANGGSGKSIKSLPTANGYVQRNNDLSTIEKKAIWQWMDQKGWLTKEFKSDWDILTPQQRGEKINGAIAWAARQGGARGKVFLDLLQKSYRYKPVDASSSNGSATVTKGKDNGGKDSNSKSTAVTTKSNNGYKNTKALGL